MTDITTVRDIGRVVLVVAAITTTLFPLLYATAPWYRSFLGRAVMFRAISLALVLDIAVAFTFWIKSASPIVLLWINISIIAVIGVSSAMMCMVVVQIRLPNYRKRQDDHRKQDV